MKREVWPVTAGKVRHLSCLHPRETETSDLVLGSRLLAFQMKGGWVHEVLWELLSILIGFLEDP